MNNADIKTNTGKELLEYVLYKMKNDNKPSYTSIRKLMDLLLKEEIVNEILFEIQDSYVACTVSFNPAKLELSKYFEQDAVYHQATASGKTEQEAFHRALSKMAILTKLS